MDRAWADDHQQTVIAAMQHVADRVTRFDHHALRRFGQRHVGKHLRRRRQRLDLHDAAVDDAADADLILPAGYVGIDQRVAALADDPANRLNVLGTVQRLRFRLHGSTFLLVSAHKDSSQRAERRVATASARVCSSCSVRSHGTQASVIDCP